LYYYGARYYDAKLCKWISTDPILESYLPTGNKDKDKKLPAGGVFSTTNLNLYHYAGNSPVRFIDPDGNHTCTNPSNADKYVGNVIVFALNEDGTLEPIGTVNLWGDLVNMNKQGTGNPSISSELKDAAGGREMYIMNFSTDKKTGKTSYKAISIGGANPLRVNEKDPDYSEDNTAGRQLWGTQYDVDISDGNIKINKKSSENVREKYILRQNDKKARPGVEVYNLVGGVKPNDTNSELVGSPDHDAVVQKVYDFDNKRK